MKKLGSYEQSGRRKCWFCVNGLAHCHRQRDADTRSCNSTVSEGNWERRFFLESKTGDDSALPRNMTSPTVGNFEKRDRTPNSARQIIPTLELAKSPQNLAVYSHPRRLHSIFTTVMILSYFVLLISTPLANRALYRRRGSMLASIDASIQSVLSMLLSGVQQAFQRTKYNVLSPSLR